MSEIVLPQQLVAAASNPAALPSSRAASPDNAPNIESLGSTAVNTKANTTNTTAVNTPGATSNATSKTASKTASEVDLLLEHETEKAARYTETEHSLTFTSALKLYYPAVIWALVVNLATLCQGLDGQVIGALVGIQPFKHHFGVEYQGEYIIEAEWLGAFNYANKVGSIIGAFCAGMAYDRLGLRRVIALSSALSIGFVFVQFFASHPAQLVAGIFFNGCVISFFTVCATAYVGEVCPVVLRGFAASAINLLLVAGQLMGSGILKIASNIDSEWAFKFPIASQWPLPVIMLLFTLGNFLPDPPYWLCKRGEYEAAENSLRRLAVADVDPTLKLSFVRETLRIENDAKQGSKPRMSECFKGTDRRRLIICLMVYAIQALVGAVVFHDFAVYFFELSGLSADDAFSMNVGVNAIGFIGSCLAWWFLQFLGRRDAYLWGCIILAGLQGLVGVLDLIPRPAAGTSPSSWGQSAIIITCNLVYDITIGPYGFVLLSEVASARLRGFNIGLSCAFYQLCAIALAIGVPFLINQDQANLGGKIGFIFAAIGGLCALFCFLCLPETKGRTFEELDHMFNMNLHSRKFKDFKIRHSHETESTEDGGQGAEKTTANSETDVSLVA
ncbi:sugar porter family MFS transporter [Diaporthe helianthi]|uniref:Sugar porter family MFS transporter n=1 Tax=Diaporthe helianthi TaxID=158607 RepID=A0A2P5I816_DIAHE|nr:sugar porter family MFS transporter [Diaporthe helianthi]